MYNRRETMRKKRDSGNVKFKQLEIHGKRNKEN